MSPLSFEDKVLRWLFGITCAIVVLVVWSVLWSPGFAYGDGVRTGTVLKLSRKGVFWPTWEGTLGLGQGAALVTWDFTVPSDEVARALAAASTDGRVVTVHYTERILRGASYGSTGYDVVEVRQ